MYKRMFRLISPLTLVTWTAAVVYARWLLVCLTSTQVPNCLPGAYYFAVGHKMI
jgi:hypothetical protein